MHGTTTLDKFAPMTELNARNVPCGPVLDMGELMADASLAARGTGVEVAHQERGTVKTVGCPIKLSDSAVAVTASPLLGEHTEDIFKEIVDYGDQEIVKARADGAI